MSFLFCLKIGKKKKKEEALIRNEHILGEKYYLLNINICFLLIRIRVIIRFFFPPFFSVDDF